MDFQGTLFADQPQGRGSLVDALGGAERHVLAHGAWVDVRRTWLPEPDDVFDALVSRVPWRAEQRQMYDRLVDVPRLVHTYMIGEELTQHAGSPGQGWAICASIAISTLA